MFNVAALQYREKLTGNFHFKSMQLKIPNPNPPALVEMLGNVCQKGTFAEYTLFRSQQGLLFILVKWHGCLLENASSLVYYSLEYEIPSISVVLQ